MTYSALLASRADQLVASWPEHPAWEQAAAAHQARAEEFTRPHLARRRAGKTHPIFDFLFEYYPIRPAQIAFWHPGVGFSLPASAPHADHKFYRRRGERVELDLPAFLAKRGQAVRFIRDLLVATRSRQPLFDCFALHEWAMVYQTDSPRHSLPLRPGIKEVVESHCLKCTHYDAFRFFTPAAAPLNKTQLTRELQRVYEQPGCLHANMDLYKWAYKCAPLIPGELWLDCFELAQKLRALDMQASPYDNSAYGFPPLEIETPAGKALFVAKQREYAQQAAQLRDRLIAVLDVVVDVMDTESENHG